MMTAYRMMQPHVNGMRPPVTDSKMWPPPMICACRYGIRNTRLTSATTVRSTLLW